MIGMRKGGGEVMDAAEAYAMGRKVAEAGMPARAGLAWTSEKNGCGRLHDNVLEHYMVLDFRDELTEIACILWVEDVAREVYGDTAVVETIRVVSSGMTRLVVRLADMLMVVETGSSLPESAIAAVTVMRGGEG